MHSAKLRVAFTAASFTLFVGSTHAADVTSVLGRMRQALEPGTDMRANVVFNITNAQGETVEWSGRLYRQGGRDARMRLVFESPLDLRGTDVTVWRSADGEPRTRIYLPALRRVREISADVRGESFLGTDFNFEDLGFEQLDHQQHAVKGEDKVDGRPCWVLESVPDDPWWYGRIVRCVDQGDYLPRRAEYFDRAGSLIKRRTFDRVENVQSHPTPVQITMTTVPARTWTRITLHDVTYDSGIPDTVFEEK